MAVIKCGLVFAIMAICIASSNCFDIGRIFGLKAVAEVDAQSPPANEYAESAADDFDLPTKKPLLSLSNLPGLPTLHIGEKPQDGKPQKPTVKPPITVNFPTLSLPQLPQLPQFPQKKPAPKVTKTVFVEITKRITRNPVCITAYPGKVPCGQVAAHNGPHNNDYYGHYPKSENNNEEREESFESEEESVYIEPTAALRMPEATALWYGDDIVDEDMEPSELRQGKYLEFRRTPIVDTPVEFIDTEAVDDEEVEYPRFIDQLMGRGKKQTVTKTLFVTKVQNVIDNRVTATLIAENCIPKDDRFPKCRPTHHKPGHDNVGGNHYHHTKPHVAKPQSPIQNNSQHHGKPSSYYHSGIVKEIDDTNVEKQNSDKVEFEKTVESIADIVSAVQKKEAAYEE